jgi:hypothetical protein
LAVTAIILLYKDLAYAPEQTPTQFSIGPDVEFISVDYLNNCSKLRACRLLQAVGKAINR